MRVSKEAADSEETSQSEHTSYGGIVEKLSKVFNGIEVRGKTQPKYPAGGPIHGKEASLQASTDKKGFENGKKKDSTKEVLLPAGSTMLDTYCHDVPLQSSGSVQKCVTSRQKLDSLASAFGVHDQGMQGGSLYSNSNYDYDSSAYSYQDDDPVDSKTSSNGDGASDTFDCNLSESEDANSYVQGGYHPVKVGEIYDGRYRIEGKLGWGFFSTVWLATDLQSKPVSFVAIKFQRSAPNHTEAICDEMKLHLKVRDQVICRPWMRTKKQYKDVLGPLYNPTRGVVSFLNWFKVDGPNGTHICVVLEPMGPNILSLIKIFKFKGVPFPLVRKITAHVLLGLDYLHRVCGIIHTDLKPENILVTSKLHNHTPLTVINDDTSDGLNDGTKGFMDVPYVKKEIKQSLSDPTCLTTYNDPHALQETLIRKPYDHIPRNLVDSLSKGDAKFKDPLLYHPAYAKIFGLKPTIIGTKKRPIVIKTQEGDVQIKPVDLSTFDCKEATFKICDLGNACWIDKHFTDEIQTRQYRAPETILKCGYDQSSDLWSLACIVFELITGDYLFDPHGSNALNRDINHLQLIVELLGPIPRHMIKSSARLKHHEREINNVKPWPLESVLVRKYKLDPPLAKELATFLLCMLKTNPNERLPADMLLHHKWLQVPLGQ
ncbi:protein kinase domain containing protein [Babesia divergens]|uniref:non-specific serine/threonine protein kinase n=1 Tax=Babesia divergens TaxID=32595 RepID=A0AAD9G790_BABDI|nr:protein kinase domain containing protein [Babesia divergens]